MSDRSYSAPMTVEAALAEARARADAQFTAAAVEALEKLAAARRPHAGGGAAAPADRLSRHGAASDP